MKILLVSLNHAPEQTGIGKFHGEMAEWFVKRGHEVRVVTAPPYYPEWKIRKGYSAWLYTGEEMGGARVYRAPIYVPSVQSGARRLLHLASFALSSMPLIVGQALFWRPQVILCSAPPLMAAPSVLVAGLLSGARTHLHVQDFEVDAAFKLGLLRSGKLFHIALTAERFLLRVFQKVSTISPRMRDRLMEKGVSEDRAFLIPNWAGTGDFDPARGGGNWRQRLAIGADTLLALYSGNMGRKQGLEVIIEAAEELQANSRIRFIISGDGAGREELVEQAKGLQNVTFVPVQPLREFIHLMLAADIHLLPQKAEAADLVMPSKLGNMLASGKPIVAGAKPGTQIFEAVKGCGIAVNPEGVDEFVAALECLADDEDLRRSLGETGRARAEAEWSRDGVLLRLEKLLS